MRKDRPSLIRHSGTALAALALAALACNAPIGESSVTPTRSVAEILTPVTALPAPAGPEQTPATPSTTITPPTPIPTPTECGYWATFIEDVTVEDGTEIAAGSTFEKTWRVRNDGCLPWTEGTELVFADGEQMSSPEAVPVPPAGVGEMVDVTVTLTAPAEPGEYRGDWLFRSPEGLIFGQNVYVQIKVVEAAGATDTTPAPDQTPTWQPFAGEWVNQDAETSGITRIQIRGEGDTIHIRMWSACVPTECDWGEVTLPASEADDGILSLQWDKPYGTETQQILMLFDGRLQVIGQVDYSDPDQEDTSYLEFFKPTE